MLFSIIAIGRRFRKEASMDSPVSGLTARFVSAEAAGSEDGAAEEPGGMPQAESISSKRKREGIQHFFMAGRSFHSRKWQFLTNKIIPLVRKTCQGEPFPPFYPDQAGNSPGSTVSSLLSYFTEVK
jgi:hypothetical protein